MAQPDPDLVEALRQTLHLAERGSLRAFVLAALSHDGEPLRVICTGSRDIPALLGTMSLVQHSLIHEADADDDEEPEDDGAVARAMFGPAKGEA